MQIKIKSAKRDTGGETILCNIIVTEQGQSQEVVFVLTPADNEGLTPAVRLTLEKMYAEGKIQIEEAS